MIGKATISQSQIQMHLTDFLNTENENIQTRAFQNITQGTNKRAQDLSGLFGPSGRFDPKPKVLNGTGTGRNKDTQSMEDYHKRMKGLQDNELKREREAERSKGGFELEPGEIPPNFLHKPLQTASKDSNSINKNPSGSNGIFSGPVTNPFYKGQFQSNSNKGIPNKSTQIAEKKEQKSNVAPGSGRFPIVITDKSAANCSSLPRQGEQKPKPPPPPPQTPPPLPQPQAPASQYATPFPQQLSQQLPQQQSVPMPQQQSVSMTPHHILAQSHVQKVETSSIPISNPSPFQPSSLYAPDPNIMTDLSEQDLTAYLWQVHFNNVSKLLQKFELNPVVVETIAHLTVSQTDAHLQTMLTKHVPALEHLAALYISSAVRQSNKDFEYQNHSDPDPLEVFDLKVLLNSLKHTPSAGLLSYKRQERFSEEQLMKDYDNLSERQALQLLQNRYLNVIERVKDLAYQTKKETRELSKILQEAHDTQIVKQLDKEMRKQIRRFLQDVIGKEQQFLESEMDGIEHFMRVNHPQLPAMSQISYSEGQLSVLEEEFDECIYALIDQEEQKEDKEQKMPQHMKAQAELLKLYSDRLCDLKAKVQAAEADLDKMTNDLL